MKKLFKNLIYFIGAFLIVTPALAITIQGSHGSAMQGGSANVDVGSSSFSPLEFGSDLIAWFKASDASTITLNGSNVSRWDDKSPNANHLTQASAVRQPLYNTGVSVEFDGIDDFLQRVSLTGGNESEPFTFITVYEQLTPGAGKGIFDEGGGLRPSLRTSYTDGGNKLTLAVTGIFLTGTTILPLNTYYIVSADFNDAAPSTNLYVNGVPDIVDADAGNPSVIKRLLLGAVNDGAAGHINFRVKEHIIVGRILTMGEHNALGNSLAAEHGLTWTDVQ